MMTRTYPAGAVLAAGLLLGIAGDTLLRAPDAPGINFTLWVAAVALAAHLTYLHARGRVMSGEAGALLGLGVLLAAGFAWRDAPALKMLALLCVVVSFSLPALRAGAAWIRRAHIAEYAAAVVAAGVHAVFGAPLTLADVEWNALRGDSGGRPGWRRAAAVARGLAIATPFLIVFGGLFVAADAVFAGMVANVVRVDIEMFASHVLLIGFLGWVTAGYLRGFTKGTLPQTLVDRTMKRAPLSITEVGIVLGLLDLLFLAFILVQFRYLFGGGGMVEVTPGLTYAEYARRGFFELVAVTALMLPVILAADTLLRREGQRDEYVFRSLTGLQIALLLAVMASAFQRMRLYQDAYGLTEQRFYATALLLLLGVIVLWFAATALRGHRRRFAFGALVASFATVIVLYAINPDAVIARTNIDRVRSGADAAGFDASYVASLSGDAVPALLAGFPALSADARCRLSARLLQRWGAEKQAPARTWSWSASRARQVVRRHEAALRREVDAEGQCRPAESGEDATGGPSADRGSRS